MSPGGPTAREPSNRRTPPSPDELAADARLVAALAATGCEGRLWDLTARRLAGLGVGALHTIILGGWLEQTSTELGRPIHLSPDELAALRAEDDERRDVVHEAVVKALDLFRRRAVLAGKWTVEGGARLDTYFVNGAVLALANPVRRWLVTRRAELRTEPWSPGDLDAVRENGGCADGALVPGPVVTSPVDELLDREDTAAVLARLGPVLGKAALIKILTGWSWAEVAPAVGLSPKALERRLRRFRDRHDPRDTGAGDD